LASSEYRKNFASVADCDADCDASATLSTDVALFSSRDAASRRLRRFRDAAVADLISSESDLTLIFVDDDADILFASVAAFSSASFSSSSSSASSSASASATSYFRFSSFREFLIARLLRYLFADEKSSVSLMKNRRRKWIIGIGEAKMKDGSS